ncbi:hypothetical protein [Planomonospora venezuelensis]|uniref:Uncharacterized protein n=1 Tax=Planomonospora venezuelensis TaxID=1999 RepID=A0A841D6E5_PLAVE|nr:hypothetical protein [Planomonospora venezuelensis]MBB5964483.1 hypothetical protein [Planomonospora venezuelensis]
MPEQAFRLVSGVTEPLMEKTYGGESSGECQDPDASLPPLIVTWLWAGEGTSQEHLDYLLDSRRQLYSRYDGTTLPTDLGKGWAAYLSTSALPDPLYRVSAKFRCDGKDRMIDIYLAQVAEGRDAIKDMIELMRIAQKRYGELYGCTPGT